MTFSRAALRRAPERGLITLGTILIVAMVLLVGYMAVRGGSTLSEYFLVETLVKKIAHEAPASDLEAREAFDRQRGIDGIEAIDGSDLVIKRQAGAVVISFSYEKRVPLFGPVGLSIEYRGSSSP